ncbi:MAG: pyridoxal-5'-phosphate-dependent protein subunit beta [Myxococcota bacterium]
MAKLGLESHIVDQGVHKRTVQRFRDKGIALPTFAQLENPSTIPARIREQLAKIEPDAAHPLNLFRIHWYNSADRKSLADVPGYVVLPPSLTGVKAPILVALGERFPMIEAHKVLAAYGCLAPRLVTGQFDPTHNLAIWPSTGNYCRGGVAVSRIMGCRGVAILPEEMSKERFAWLDRWVSQPEDVIKTFGSESNVKEIYDKCAELDAQPENVIFNQFCEFGNVLVHYTATGKALGHIYEDVRNSHPGLELFAYVSATGSAGTLSAGDRLKDDYGARIVAVEAAECPTLLKNGFGAHNIQGIGDKHVPYVHNVFNTDFAVGVSDAASDSLFYLFNTDVGRKYLAQRRGVPAEILAALPSFGFSGIANVLAAIKVAKYYDLGPDQALITVATDGSAMYSTEKQKILEQRFHNRFDDVDAGQVFGQYMLGQGVDWLQELTREDRERIFNLGYFTWVEQQGVSLPEFIARRDQKFWRDLRKVVPEWDRLINEFNAESGVL